MSNDPQYVLLRHETEPGAARASHWDIMLQQEDCLWTWATESLPADWLIAMAASQVADANLLEAIKPIAPEASPLQTELLEPSPLQSFDLLAMGEPKWASLDDTIDEIKEQKQAAQERSSATEAGLVHHAKSLFQNHKGTHQRPRHFEEPISFGTGSKNRNDSSIPQGQTWKAIRLPDHRLAYLDYEGPISGDRGRVVRCFRGALLALSDYETEHHAYKEQKGATVSCRQITAELGPPLAGQLTLQCKDESACDSTVGIEWELSWQPIAS